MATLIRDGPGQSEEPGTPSVSSTWLAGTRTSSVALPGELAGSWIRNETIAHV